MRAGKLDRTITLERSVETVDDYGVTTSTWTPLATVRAQLVEQSTDEFLKTFAESSETAVAFRVRHLADVRLTDRLVYAGSIFDLVGLKEIGRHRGLELRAKRSGP